MIDMHATHLLRAAKHEIYVLPAVRAAAAADSQIS